MERRSSRSSARLYRTALLSIALFLSPSVSFGQTVETQLDPARQQCEAHLGKLRQKAEFWRWIGAGIAGLGGVVAAGTGLVASRSQKTELRKKLGYLALISGGLAAASPLLPREVDIGKDLSLADKHYIVGLKVQRQLPDLDPERRFRRDVAKYAMARFTDCIAEDPRQEVPDLPRDLVAQEVVLGAEAPQPEALQPPPPE